MEVARCGWVSLTRMQDSNHPVPEALISSPHRELYEFALELAREAGRVIRTAFYARKNITFKSDVDLVTETDRAVEKLVMSKIRERYPDHTFVAEEVSLSVPRPRPRHTLIELYWIY